MYERPAADEYAAYYGRYIEQVRGEDVLALLESQMEATQALLATIDASRAGYRYAPDKWSIKEVVGHLTDVERVFNVRALAFARQDPHPWPGIDQDAYVKAGEFDARSLTDIAAEFQAVREAGLRLYRSLSEEATRCRGVASDCTFTVRAIPWILAGHEKHHVGVLRERYL